jgi:flagellar biosynthetic protein FliR
MDLATQHVVPLVLVLGRISAFLATLPVFGWLTVPMRVRVGLAVVLTALFAIVLPPAALRLGGNWLEASLLLVREIITGLGLGLAVALVFSAVNQAAEIIRIQMGLAEASIIDPLSGQESQPLGTLMEMTFAVLLLVAGGHRLILALVVRSYEAFPLGQPAEVAALTESLIQAGSLMLVFGLKLAAPLLAAFLLLAVVLAILARVLPEMNILLASLPLRVGLGFFMAAAFMPTLSDFTSDFGEWLRGFCTT